MMKAWRKRLWGAGPINRILGTSAERLVARDLHRRGYRVLARNLRNRCGEIDIVAEAPDRRTIAVVEVKASAQDEDAVPAEIHVNLYKQRKLVALACQLARWYRLTDRPIRFDIAGVHVPALGPPVIRYHAGAFESHV